MMGGLTRYASMTLVSRPEIRNAKDLIGGVIGLQRPAVESAVQAVINHLAEGDPKFAKHKPAEFIESGPLAELDRSGYIDRLYAGQDTKSK